MSGVRFNLNRKNVKMKDADLPTGWVLRPSKRHPERYYYLNTITKETSWDPPEISKKVSCSSSKSGETKFSNRDVEKEKIKNKLGTKMKLMHKEKLSKINLQKSLNSQKLIEVLDLKNLKPKSIIQSSSLLTSAKKGEIKQIAKKLENKNQKSSNGNKFIKNSNINKTALQKENDIDTVNMIVRKQGEDKIFQKDQFFATNAPKDNIEVESLSKKKILDADATKKNESYLASAIFEQQKTFFKEDESLADKFESTKERDGNKFSTYSKEDTCIITTHVNQHQDKNLSSIEKVRSSVLNDKIEDYCEEMDWETSNENLELKTDTHSDYVNTDFYTTSNKEVCTFVSGNELPSKGILVLDTNILLNCLDFITNLRDTNIPCLGYPILYIPWRVLQELDSIKDNKNGSRNKDIQSNARKAISFVHENLKSRHPRCWGQSFEETKLGNETPDDQILQACLQLKKEYTDKKVILITNDKNLESKAILSNIEVDSQLSFKEKYTALNIEKDLSSDSHSKNNENKFDPKQVDNLICQIKDILNDCLPSILECEMRIAFGDEWKKICYLKPPWSLRNCLDCFKKHWRSVFFLVFGKEVLNSIEKLYQILFCTKGDSSPEAIYNEVQTLLNKIKSSRIKSKPYKNSVVESINKLLKLESMANSCNIESNNENPSSDASRKLTPTSDEKEKISYVQQLEQAKSVSDDFNNVKDLFRNVWDLFKELCGAVTATINSPDNNNKFSLVEKRLELTQGIGELEKLIQINEKILELRTEDITDRHPLIISLKEFFVRIFPFMEPSLQAKLSKCLAIFFSILEGRILLTRSQNDFKEFLQILVKGMMYANLTLS